MTNLQISKTVKAQFKKFKRNDESIDEAFARLFESSNIQSYECIEGNTSIFVNEENYNKLMSFKAYPTESVSSVVLRLLEATDW